jgi:hypothetical protein
MGANLSTGDVERVEESVKDWTCDEVVQEVNLLKKGETRIFLLPLKHVLYKAPIGMQIIVQKSSWHALERKFVAKENYVELHIRVPLD